MVKMDKLEIKKILKPLMKECIREVLMEQGLIKILSETVEQPQVVVKKQPVVQEKPQINEARKKMVEDIGKSGYMNNKFDPFANTKPLTEAQAAGAPGPMSNIDPSDSGVDISGLMNTNKNAWKARVGGKGK